MATETDTTQEEGVSQTAESQQDAAVTDTTVSDGAAAPAAEEPAPLPPMQARRKGAMDAALAGRKAKLEEELQQARDDGIAVDPEPEPEPSPEPTPEPSATQAATQVPGPTAAPSGGEPMVTVKVNGIERQIPQSELVAGYQKSAGADQKFRDAANLRDEAATILRQAGGATPAASPAPAQEPAATESAAAVSPEKLRKVVEAMQMGTAEDGEAALAALVADLTKGRGDSTATPDINAITSQVQDALRAQTEYTTALETVGREFPEIFGKPKEDGTVEGADPHLIELAANETHKVRASALIELGYDKNDVIHNLSANPREIKRVYDACVQKGLLKGDLHLFRTAAKRVSDWDKSRRPAPAQTSAPSPTPALTPAPTQAPINGQQTRLERKAGIPQKPLPTSARAPIETGEKPPRSKSEYVANLRKVRGQG